MCLGESLDGLIDRPVSTHRFASRLRLYPALSELQCFSGTPQACEVSKPSYRRSSRKLTVHQTQDTRQSPMARETQYRLLDLLSSFADCWGVFVDAKKSLDTLYSDTVKRFFGQKCLVATVTLVR